MTDLKKVAKLVGKLQLIIEELETRPILVLHQNINQFYYMQKSTELQLLHDQMKELLEKEETIRVRLMNHYGEIFCQWKKDTRWLSLYMQATVKSEGVGE